MKQSEKIRKKFKSKISWREKLERVAEHKIVNIPPKMQARFGRGTMLIPKPLDVDALIREVKKGRLVTRKEIGDRLSRDFNTDSTCPITTGIFIRIISETAEEDFEKGKKTITPYWRIVGNDGSLNEKFPGGMKRQAENLKREGMKIEKSKNGKHLIVKDFEKFLTIL